MRSNSFTDNLSALLFPLVNAGGEVYEVGGPVRDKLMQRAHKDYDVICRKLTIEQITKILSPYGKIATVGKSFGITKFSPHKNSEIEIDIALPRKERSTGTHHRDFDVNFDPNLSIEEDLERRDFTINAMAMLLPDGKIIDPFGGKNDIEAKLIRQVFPKTFEEDPLRLIRAIQFATRFNFTIEPVTWAAVCENAKLIETISGERISAELVKIMAAEKPSIGFDLLFESGILKYILPELVALKGIEQDKQPGDDVYAHTMRVLDAARKDPEIDNKGNLELLFAALLHDTGKEKTSQYHEPTQRIVFFGHQLVSARIAKRLMKNLKLSSVGVNSDTVVTLIEHHMFETKASFTDRAIRRFVAKIGKDLISLLMDLRLADNRGGKHPNGIKGVLRLKSRIKEELAKKPPFGAKDLAINGNDLIKLDISEGPQIGQILNHLVELVLDYPQKNERDVLLALVKEKIKNET